jgi:DNA polymerase I-like protein with 3'-5' exonuclease and polymerase domains
MIQGDGADLFKTAVVRVGKFLRSVGAKTRMSNFVHDEIQFYWHKDELDLIPKVKAIMEDFKFCVPIVAEVSYSDTSWADKKEWR